MNPRRCLIAVICAFLLRAAFGAPDEAIVSRIRRTPVASSAIGSVGYSKRLHALEIEFRNGAIYRYLDVPNQVYTKLLAADSKARFYDENVRGHYRSVHVKSRAE